MDRDKRPSMHGRSRAMAGALSLCGCSHGRTHAFNHTLPELSLQQPANSFLIGSHSCWHAMLMPLLRQYCSISQPKPPQRLLFETALNDYPQEGHEIRAALLAPMLSLLVMSALALWHTGSTSQPDLASERRAMTTFLPRDKIIDREAMLLEKGHYLPILYLIT